MKKITITLLLAIYAFMQLIVVGWDIYKPAIHTVCYNIIRVCSNEKRANNIIIKTDKTAYQKALQDENEILWQGELYDIKNIAIDGNEVTLIVEKDAIETNWVNVYNAVQQKIKKDSPNQPSQNPNYCKWLFKLYMPVERLTPAIFIHPSSINNNLYNVDYYSNCYINNPSQPPDMVC